MYIKPYDVALAVGRYQPIHIGHENNINTAIALADRVLILVGSAQEAGTQRNPFDIGLRIRMIQEIYGDSVIVAPLPDLTNEKDIGSHWGSYVLDKVKYYVGKIPDIMVYGDEDAAGWFGAEDLRFIRMVMPRSRIPFSSTQGRDMLLMGNEEEWQKWHNPKLHKHYTELRERLLRCPTYAKRYAELTKAPLKGWSDKEI